jgi:beta-glucanase (GH16 family)
MMSRAVQPADNFMESTVSRLMLVIFIFCMPLMSAESWTLVWSDEFDFPEGAPPDPSKWAHDVGGGGWGNRELQSYTTDLRNASHDGKGHLVLRAVRQPDGTYTSARLKTLGRFEWQYGKVEARIKLPFGQGIWPAFWMLGHDFPVRGWPACGEIDVMEHIGREPSTVYGTVHGPGYSGKHGISSNVKIYGSRLSDDFHVFAAVWSPASIEFSLDGDSYGRVTHDRLPRRTRWAFDQPFFLLLNVAVGGKWPGYPDKTTTFPQEMLVDWIRVWRAEAATK